MHVRTYIGIHDIAFSHRNARSRELEKKKERERAVTRAYDPTRAYAQTMRSRKVIDPRAVYKALARACAVSPTRATAPLASDSAPHFSRRRVSPFGVVQCIVQCIVQCTAVDAPLHTRPTANSFSPFDFFSFLECCISERSRLRFISVFYTFATLRTRETLRTRKLEET